MIPFLFPKKFNIVNDKQTTDERNMTGLLIFHVVSELQNSGKSMKSCEIHKNMQNTAKFSGNLVKYMSVQRF